MDDDDFSDVVLQLKVGRSERIAERDLGKDGIVAPYLIVNFGARSHGTLIWVVRESCGTLDSAY